MSVRLGGAGLGVWLVEGVSLSALSEVVAVLLLVVDAAVVPIRYRYVCGMTA